MKNYLSILLLVLSTSSVMFAQKTCESKEDSMEDLMSITKCTIKSSKKNKGKRARQISVSVSAPKRRFLKKRNTEKKATASSIDNKLNTSGVSGVNNSSTTITKGLNLKKLASSVGNKLSAEEVRKASKFSLLDEVPAFKGCEDTSGHDRLDCFNEHMMAHIQKHFSYPSDAVVKKIEGEIWVRFIIDNNGRVSNIKTLGPANAKILKTEAERVVSKLPVLTPGKKDGKSVSVKYGFPINFSLQNN